MLIVQCFAESPIHCEAFFYNADRSQNYMIRASDINIAAPIPKKTLFRGTKPNAKSS